MSNFFFDTHMHIDLFDDRDEIIKFIEDEEIYCIAMTNLPVLFKKYYNSYIELKYVRFALGFHPELIGRYYDQISIFREHVKDTRYIGEIGLDFSIKNPESQQKQVEIFSEIVELCSRYGDKILSVHSRKASKEVINLLSSFNGKVILHWYSGTKRDLEIAVSRGYYFSINQNMINSTSGKKIIQMIPQNKILVETDAPFTLGQKKKYDVDAIIGVYDFLANYYNRSQEEIMEMMKDNFRKVLFRSEEINRNDSI